MLKTDRGMFPASAAAEQSLDRRRFLHVAGAAVVAAVCGESLAARYSASEVPTIALAAIRGLPAGATRVVKIEDTEVLAVGLASGEVVAFDRRCPHLGCPVVWSAENQRFECPCHRAAFDARSGAVLFGPPRRGLTPAVVTA